MLTNKQRAILLQKIQSLDVEGLSKLQNDQTVPLNITLNDQKITALHILCQTYHPENSEDFIRYRQVIIILLSSCGEQLAN